MHVIKGAYAHLTPGNAGTLSDQPSERDRGLGCSVMLTPDVLGIAIFFGVLVLSRALWAQSLYPPYDKRWRDASNVVFVGLLVGTLLVLIWSALST